MSENVERKKKKATGGKLSKEKKGTDNDDDFFFLTFVAEYVELTLKLTATDTQTNIILPLTVRGFLLEQDDRYYYLGEHPNAVSQAVEKELVGLITAVEHKDYADTLLDGLTAEREEDIN